MGRVFYTRPLDEPNSGWEISWKPGAPAGSRQRLADIVGPPGSAAKQVKLSQGPPS